MTASIANFRTAATAPARGQARFDHLILAIGQPTFRRVLFETLQALGNADRCLVFKSAAPAESTCVIDAGISAKASQAVLLKHEKVLLAPTLHERRRLARLAGIADIFAFTACAGRRTCTVFVLRERNGQFTADELSALSLGSEVIGASIIKHLQKPQDPFDRDGVISRVITRSGAFECLTNREQSVCVGILTGHTTEAIALHLGISINSVLTFRRRAYQKLGISSQNELFMRVLETANSL